MGYLLGTDFPSIAQVTASSEAPGALVDNAVNAARPFLVWRSQSVAVEVVPAWIQVDFGRAVVLDGVFLNNFNVSSVEFQRSANGTSWVSLGTQASPVDRRVNRRKGYYRFAGFAHQYLRAIFDIAYYVQVAESGWVGTPQYEGGDVGLGGDPGRFECGALLPVGSVTPLTVHAPVWPRDWLRAEADEIVGYVGGGYEVHTQGHPKGTFFLHFKSERNTAGRAEAKLLSALDGTTPFLLVEDFGHPEHAYYVRRLEDDAVRESFKLVERERFLVEEVT